MIPVSAAKEIMRLRRRIEELEELCGLREFPLEIPIFFGQYRHRLHLMARLFLSRGLVSKTAIFLAFGGDDYSDHTANVYIHHLRKQFRSQGITIRTDRGRGWYLDLADKAKLRGLLQEASA